MKPIPFMAACITMLAGAAAMADVSVRDVVRDLQSQGYVDIEVEREGGRISVEARKRGQEREVTYDSVTGRILRDETSRYGGMVRERVEVDFDDRERGDSRGDRGGDLSDRGDNRSHRDDDRDDRDDDRDDRDDDRDDRDDDRDDRDDDRDDRDDDRDDRDDDRDDRDDDRDDRDDDDDHDDDD
ncbi:hypothetical protein C8N32_10625 [Rhodovulum imhoffii]|uniref:PepSY domain-containing protein n=1 Tax=Rhodovulum imhoffii TaxID=365340 RepID=A0A2T5BSW2_9RHOB|nr:PepSY domain-containing protein [Rhodovulum imhoffii]MBK5934995.1 hypothetical protein [Rhodovulum imhoffii]PTN02454.1 hypothetical protein C8N32_10625 [Rhodovulum imhoffii]